MNRLLIDVNHLSAVLEQYDQIKLYRADTESGSYTEITDVTSRIDLIPAQEQYYYDDSDGHSDHWYKASYYNSSTAEESQLGDAFQAQTYAEKIGYSFDNYSPPPGEWGKILTADDMRYTYMFGIDAIATDSQESEFTDAQFDYFIEAALEEVERYLTLDIRRRVYKTNPDNTAVRAPKYRANVDFTDYDDPYEFDPKEWQNYGFVQFRHWPLIKIDRAILYSPVKGEVLDFLEQDWVRMSRNVGQLHLFPKSGFSYGPYQISGMPWILLGQRYPSAFEFDYQTGFETSDFVPRDLRDLVGMYAAIKALDTIGDGLLAGFSSQSVSLDGLSESFSSTQSATSAYFGARLKSYADHIETILERNRYKFGPPPMSFVGV
jgi:hypothetical protein